jgi:hypothetical protein
MWIGIEIGPVDDIMSRFAKSEDEAKTMAAFRKNYNCLFTENTLRERYHKGLWTCETVRQNDRSKKYPIIRKVQLNVVDRS